MPEYVYYYSQQYFYFSNELSDKSEVDLLIFKFHFDLIDQILQFQASVDSKNSFLHGWLYLLKAFCSIHYISIFEILDGS